ncbi:exodeoxyribonuclease VII large subunit, partial [Frischella perrara]
LRLQLQKAKNDFAIQASQLNTVSPLATLERGYSITSDQHGKAINSIDNLNIGDTITTNLISGKIISTINTIEKP